MEDTHSATQANGNAFFYAMFALAMVVFFGPVWIASHQTRQVTYVSTARATVETVAEEHGYEIYDSTSITSTDPAYLDARGKDGDFANLRVIWSQTPDGELFKGRGLVDAIVDPMGWDFDLYVSNEDTVDNWTLLD